MQRVTHVATTHNVINGFIGGIYGTLLVLEGVLDFGDDIYSLPEVFLAI